MSGPVCWTIGLHREELWSLVAHRACRLTALLISPSERAQTHDGALALVHFSGFALGPVGLSDGFLVQPVPFASLRAAAQADPHVVFTAVHRLLYNGVDVWHFFRLGEADQIQTLFSTELNGRGPTVGNIS